MPEDLREIYRHVAALQASGTRVHRQLVVSSLDVQAAAIPGLLGQLAGIVDEYDIDVRIGLYGWATRHPVIATTISQYKFSDQTELYTLLARVVESLNPAIPLELRTLRDLCNAEFGVKRLQSLEAQLDIYKRLIALAPGERIPRHRLIATLLRHSRTDMADQAIREAELAVGLDSPINRYKVMQTIKRAQETDGILPEDRLAMLRHAEQIALSGLQRFPQDKYPYLAYGSVGLAMAEMSGETTVLDDGIVRMRGAWETLLDNMLDRNLKVLEERRRQITRTALRA